MKAAANCVFRIYIQGAEITGSRMERQKTGQLYTSVRTVDLRVISKYTQLDQSKPRVKPNFQKADKVNPGLSLGLLWC